MPKVGWVRFNLSRPVPAGVKSYRVTRDRAGRWHIAFAHVPDPITGPGDCSVVGIDRGVAVSAALSTGELLNAPILTPGESKRLNALQQRLARCKRGSHRRDKTKRSIAKLKARERDRREDWVEKTSTDLARRFNQVSEWPRNGDSTVRSAELAGASSSLACSTRLPAGSSRSRLPTRRNDAPHAGTSHPETARAKRSSSAKPALLGGATPTSTLHATSPPDGR